MKCCFKCGEEKPLDAFYRHPMMADGYLNKCIECAKSDVRSNRSARAAYYQAYDRQRAKDPKRVADRAERNKGQPRTENDPAKRAARVAVGNALRDGRLLKAPECEICARIANLHGHHEDYSKPLEVIWVCSACHAFVHAYWRAQERMAG